MVSVTVLVVSVVEVIEPWVKFGTTGTALAGDASKNNSKKGTLLTMTYFIVNEVTCCPVATVPAPPAVSVTAPALVMVPASVSFVPAAVDV